MKRKKKTGKTNGQLIVRALLTGRPLRIRDISKMISKEAGREIKVQDFSSILSKISDKKRCDLGHFVKRKKDGNSFVYSIVEEALELSEDKVYGLTLKVGKDKYKLEDALNESPGLGKYVKGVDKAKPVKARTKRKKRVVKTRKVANRSVKPAPVKVKAEPEVKVEAEPNPPVKESASVEIPVDMSSVSGPLAELIGKIADLGNAKINVNINVKFDK